MDIDDQPALRIEDTRASRNKHEQNEVLKAQHAAGVQKTRDKKRPLRRNQRLRLAKGFERATVVLDQMEKKVNRSEKKNKTIKGRRVSNRPHSCVLVGAHSLLLARLGRCQHHRQVERCRNNRPGWQDSLE